MRRSRRTEHNLARLLKPVARLFYGRTCCPHPAPHNPPRSITDQHSCRLGNIRDLVPHGFSRPAARCHFLKQCYSPIDRTIRRPVETPDTASRGPNHSCRLDRMTRAGRFDQTAGSEHILLRTRRDRLAIPSHRAAGDDVRDGFHRMVTGPHHRKQSRRQHKHRHGGAHHFRVLNKRSQNTTKLSSGTRPCVLCCLSDLSCWHLWANGAQIGNLHKMRYIPHGRNGQGHISDSRLVN